MTENSEKQEYFPDFKMTSSNFKSKSKIQIHSVYNDIKQGKAANPHIRQSGTRERTMKIVLEPN